MPRAKNPPSTGSKAKRGAAMPSTSLEALASEAEFKGREWQENADADPRPRQPGRLLSAPERELGRRIQQTREAKRITQGDLSLLTKGLDDEEKGISRAVISLYEAGTNRPSPKEIRLLCEALQVTPNFLIYGDEHPFDESSHDYERFGTIARRHDPEGYAWVAYVMSSIHHNHYDAVMKLVLDLARGWDKSFDEGLQEKANQQLLAMSAELQQRLERRGKQQKPPSVKKKS